MRNKKIAIKGAYGSGNFGDDALMYVAGCVVQKVTGPENILFICNRTLPYIYKMFPQSKFVTRVSRTAYADVLVYGGGTQFFSFPLTANTSSISKRLLRSLNSPLSIVNKIINRIRYKAETKISQNRIALGVGVGPFVDGSQQQIQAHDLFDLLSYVSVRDESSLDYCSKWGIKNPLLRSDLCFMTEYFSPMIKSHKDEHGEIKNIGIIVRDWGHTSEGGKYIERLPELAKMLRNKNYQVTFVSFQTLGDKKVLDFLRKNNEKILEWDTNADTISGFVNKLNEFDLFYSARYHGAVFAAILGKPVICVEVEQKLKLVSTLLGEGAKCWSYPFDVNNAVSALDDLTANLDGAKMSLSKAVSSQEKLAKEMVDEFIGKCS